MSSIEWKKISIKGIAKIEKCVAEFNVTELEKTPHGKFKVKIYERQVGGYVGYTNLQVKDIDGCPYCGIGYGETVDEALEDTINYFLKMISQKKKISKDDFECMDAYDF